MATVGIPIRTIEILKAKKATPKAAKLANKEREGLSERKYKADVNAP